MTEESALRCVTREKREINIPPGNVSLDEDVPSFATLDGAGKTGLFEDDIVTLAMN